MDKLIIDQSAFSPKVVMDPDANRFEISGESRPEDAGKVYRKILNWLDKYYTLRYWKDSSFSGDTPNAIFEFKFDYFNSTSAKFILDILKKIKKYREDKVNIKVVWYYNSADMDMKESGEEFERLSGVLFEYVMLPN